MRQAPVKYREPSCVGLVTLLRPRLSVSEYLSAASQRLRKMVDDGSEKLAEAQLAAAEAAKSSTATVDWAFQAIIAFCCRA